MAWSPLLLCGSVSIVLASHAAHGQGKRVLDPAGMKAALAQLAITRVKDIPRPIYERDGYARRYDGLTAYRVTPAQRALPVAGSYTVGDFLSPELRFPDSWLYVDLHVDASGDQYLLLDRRLVLKLLHVVRHLAARGYSDEALVLFGHRTERVNRYLHRYRTRAFGRTSLATRSYHLTGKALDLRLGDLNGDGAVDARDHRALVCAIQAVERAHPGLRGGLGLYAQSVHTDVRGQPARWCGPGGNRSPLCGGRILACPPPRDRYPSLPPALP